MTRTGRKASIRRLPRVLSAAGLVLLVGIGAGGQAAAKEKDEEKKRSQYTVNESMHKKLTGAQEYMEAEEYAAARELLGSLEKRAERLNPYERALVFLFLGYVEANQERYAEALDYFEKCLAEDALPAGQQLSTRFNVAQLYLATERYAEAVRSLDLWFEQAESPSSVAYYLLAVSRYQTRDIDGAIPPARQAVALAKSPKEAWLQLLTGLYFETKRYAEAVAPLEQLVTLYRRKTYWTQLSALYSQLDHEEKSLAAMQLAYREGFLEKDRELRQLAQLYLHHGLPYRAALLLQECVANETITADAQAWELLATSWLLAREYERALEPLTRAAELAEGGDLYVRVGQVYLEREQWNEASAALTKAFAKGELRDSGSANLLLGIAFYHQKRLQRARKHLGAALANESSRESASHWLELLDREGRSG